MNERPEAKSTAPWRRGRGAPTPWMMRPVLPPLEEYSAVPSFRKRAPLDAHTIRALWHDHMSGSPVRMDSEGLRMRRWTRTDRDGVLTPDEETALHDFLEALRGVDLFAFRQSCGASIYEIARVSTEGRTAMDIRCESPAGILSRRLFGRVLDSGQMVSRDFYDFAWTALHRPPLWARVSGRLLPEERARIVRECRSIARSRKGRRTRRPVLRPSDPQLARDVWATCARLLEMPEGG